MVLNFDIQILTSYIRSFKGFYGNVDLYRLNQHLHYLFIFDLISNVSYSYLKT